MLFRLHFPKKKHHWLLIEEDDDDDDDERVHEKDWDCHMGLLIPSSSFLLRRRLLLLPQPIYPS